MYHLILKQPVSCGESRPGPPNHLLGPRSLGLSVTKKVLSQVVAGIALQHLLCTWPFPVGSPWWRSSQGKGIRLTSGRIPVWNPGAQIMSLVSWCSITQRPRLSGLGYHSPFLGLVLLWRDTSALLYHILPFCSYFLFLSTRSGWESWRVGREGSLA